MARRDASCKPLYLAIAYSGAGSMAWLKNNFDQATRMHEQALSYFEQADDKAGSAFSLNNLAVQKIVQGHYADAEQLIVRGLTLARQTDSSWLVGYLLNMLGALEIAQGMPNQAFQHLQESLAIARATADLVHLGIILHNLGSLASKCGNYAQAAEYFDESLRVSEENGYLRINTGTYAEQGLLFIRQSQYAQAVAACQRGAHLALAYSFYDMCTCNLEWLAAAYAYQNQFEQAARLWGATTKWRQENGIPLAPEFHDDYTRAVAYTRAHMDETHFQKLTAQGQGLDLAQVLALVE